MSSNHQKTDPAGDHLFSTSYPAQIGPYKIEAFLQRGGMSVLYLGLHPQTKELISIKVLPQEFSSNSEMVERFLREASIIELADHPNIVKLYGQGAWEGGLYIAMEYIQGVSLKKYLLSNLISLKHALEIVMEISMALCHLHTHGVIHRDLKPDNILVTESGGIKVIDFGIAQLLTDNQLIDQRDRRRLMGTPIYMSPEQKLDPLNTSYPSDIYSLGIITYELVLGKLSKGQIYLSLMPKGLQRILSKALQIKPQDRYQDIVDFMTDLSIYLHSSELLKENRELDPLSDLSESLKNAHYSLVPHSPPTWPSMEIGLAFYKSFDVSSLYYDFFILPDDNYAIIIAEPSIKGSSGIVYTSVLRGMVRALSQHHLHPKELASSLNRLLVDDSMQLNFVFSYLLFLPSKNLLRYISCRFGQLWKKEQHSQPFLIINESPSLGLEADAIYQEIELPWNKNDTLFYYSFLENEMINNIDFVIKNQIDTCLSNPNFTPQQQVDNVLGRLKVTLSHAMSEKSVVLFSILRK